MKILDIVPSWIYALAITLLVGAVGVQQLRVSATKLEFATFKGEVEEATRKAEAEARQKEQALQTNADKLRREKDAEIKNANARAVALANSLQHRNARPSGDMPETSDARPVATGCSGSGLYRQDGEFLVGEAAAGRQCQAFLRECRAAYDKAVNP